MEVYSPGREIIVSNEGVDYSNAFGDKLKGFISKAKDKLGNIDLGKVGGALTSLSGGGIKNGVGSKELIDAQREQAMLEAEARKKEAEEKRKQTMIIVGVVGGLALIGIIAYAATRSNKKNG